MILRSKIKRVYVEESLLEHPYTREILERLALSPKVIPDGEKPPLPLAPWPEVLSWGKETLFLTRYPGRFFRPCPGTKTYLCCGYRIFHVGQGCPLDCTYCILQAYLNAPWLTFFVNVLEDGLRELEEALSSGRLLRIGTGEFTDSLALDPLTRLNERLIPLFGKQDRAVLELKTKTAAIEHLRDLPHRRRTIFSWSLNTEAIIKTEEKRTASLGERLRAAQKAVEWGYPVAFHFDPLILYPEAAEDYPAVIARLAEMIPAEEICWISLGSLRYMPSLKEIAWERFPRTKIFSHEFVVGLDGKKRYLRPLRVALYRRVAQAIREYLPGVTVYFCMESPEVWQEVLGGVPKGGLPKLLDEAAKRTCHLKA